MDRLKWLVIAIVCGGGLIWLGASLTGKDADQTAAVLMISGAVIGYLCSCMAGRQGKKHKSDD